MLLGILGHIADDDEARSIVKRLLDALPSGSYLTICDGTNDLYEAGVEAQRLYNESGAAPYRLRSARADRRVLRGPGAGGARRGVVPAVAARPRRRRPRPPPEMDQVAGVGRKP